jgi:general secretion pathway protein J
MRPAAYLRGDAGFTLVEALVAVLLTSVIMGALAAVTAQWMPGWERGVGRLQRIDALAAGLDRLVGDIAAAEIISPQGDKAPPLFDGRELSLVFVRPTLNPNSTGGLEIVRLAPTSDERGPVLVRSTIPFTPDTTYAGDADAIAFANPVTMLRGPYSISFSYAGSDRIWHDTWRQQPVLPRAVRVRLRDLATLTTLAISTTTPIYAELSPPCASAATAAQCPELALAPTTAAGSSSAGPSTAVSSGGASGTQ